MEMSAETYVVYAWATFPQLSGLDYCPVVTILSAIGAFVVGGVPDTGHGRRGKHVLFVPDQHFTWCQVRSG